MDVVVRTVDRLLLYRCPKRVFIETLFHHRIRGQLHSAICTERTLFVDVVLEMVISHVKLVQRWLTRPENRGVANVVYWYH